jgi:phosphate-selective porin OprO and OprP
MSLRPAIVAILLTSAAFPAITFAQPSDDDETSGDGDGTINHESDEVIGPDDNGQPPPDHDDVEAAMPAASGRGGYQGGFVIASDDDKFSLKIKARVQPYLVMTRTNFGEKEIKGAFEIRRARLVMEGHLHGPDLLYKVQTDFGKGNPSLKDFYFDVRLSGSTWLRAGQWKRPFSRQQITSSGKLEMSERSLTDQVFGAGRDIGIAVRNDYEDSTPIEWIVGVFNGTGEAAATTVDPMTGVVTTTNVPKEFRPALVARVGLNSDGVKGYSEADLEGGPLRWAAAASFWGETNFDEDHTSNDKVELDYLIKAQGFSTTGGFYAMTRQAGLHPLSDQELAYIGLHLQAGYMVKPAIAATARFTLIDGRPSDLVDTKDITIGGSYYGWGHDAKLQGDLRFRKTGSGKFSQDTLFILGANVGF